MASGQSQFQRDIVQGLKQWGIQARKTAKGFPNIIGRALYPETEIEATECKKRTPVNHGTLRGTIHVTGPFQGGGKVWTFIVCGGPAAPYAIYVHENLQAIHPVGQAKFIESTLKESRPYMGARVARRIKENWGWIAGRSGRGAYGQ